jgi:hypothetical protein
MVEISRALEEKVHSGSEEAILEESTSEWQESREFKPLAPRLLHHVRKTSFSNLRRSQVPQVFLKLSIFLSLHYAYMLRKSSFSFSNLTCV